MQKLNKNLILHNDIYKRVVRYSNHTKTFHIEGLKDSNSDKATYDRFVFTSATSSEFNTKNLLYRVYASLSFKEKNLLTFLLDKILPICYRKNVKSVLDIGCSTGEFLYYLDNKIKKAGIEINRAACKIARQKSLQIWEGNYSEITLKDKYNVVRAFHVLEHISDTDQFIQKLITDSSKYIVLSSPNGNSLSRYIFNASWEGFFDKTHFIIYTKEGLEVIANKNNLSIIRFSTYPMGYTAASLLRQIGLKNNILYILCFWLIFGLTLPFELLTSQFGYGDALYVEFEKKEPNKHV